jgi:hypothetical protein
MKKIFDRAAVRHFLQTVVSVALAVGLSRYLPPEAAHAIGTAAGAVVGGA